MFCFSELHGTCCTVSIYSHVQTAHIHLFHYMYGFVEESKTKFGRQTSSGNDGDAEKAIFFRGIPLVPLFKIVELIYRKFDVRKNYLHAKCKGL